MVFTQVRSFFFSIQRERRLFLRCIKKAEVVAGFKEPTRNTHRRTELHNLTFYRSSRPFSFWHKIHPSKNRKLASGIIMGAYIETGYRCCNSEVVTIIKPQYGVIIVTIFVSLPSCTLRVHTPCVIEDTVLLQCFGESAKLRKATINFVMSVFLSVRRNNSAPIGRIFMQFDISVFFETRSRKFKFH